MARYIDADLLKEVVLGWEPSLDNEQLEYEIDTMPTADVEEVKHGEWKECGFMNLQCSICHKYNVEKSRFCPYCGAKMDGGKEK